MILQLLLLRCQAVGFFVLRAFQLALKVVVLALAVSQQAARDVVTFTMAVDYVVNLIDRFVQTGLTKVRHHREDSLCVQFGFAEGWVLVA